MSDPAQTPFLAHFAALRDPRQSAKVLYPLPEILLLLLCATISGAGDFVEMTLWGAEKLGFLRRFQPYARGIPSHDTRCDVIAAIDPELFKACFLPWVEDLRADPITPDAMGTQADIAQTIPDGGGDYVLSLKANWPATCTEVETLFASPPPDLPILRSTTSDADHGRIGRTHCVRPPPCHLPRHRMDVLRAALSGGVPLSRPGRHRHDRVRNRARRQGQSRKALLSVLSQTRRRDIRARRPPCQ